MVENLAVVVRKRATTSAHQAEAHPPKCPHALVLDNGFDIMELLKIYDMSDKDLKDTKYKDYNLLSNASPFVQHSEYSVSKSKQEVIDQITSESAEIAEIE